MFGRRQRAWPAAASSPCRPWAAPAAEVGADFLKPAPRRQVLISDPSWENHRALFTNAGFRSASTPYYDAARAASASTPCWRR